jgi:hypothetical protein
MAADGSGAAPHARHSGEEPPASPEMFPPGRGVVVGRCTDVESLGATLSPSNAVVVSRMLGNLPMRTRRILCEAREWQFLHEFNIDMMRLAATMRGSGNPQATLAALQTLTDGGTLKDLTTHDCEGTEYMQPQERLHPGGVEEADEGLTLSRVWMVSVATGSPVEVWSSAYSRPPLPGPPAIDLSVLAEVFGSLEVTACGGVEAVVSSPPGEGCSTDSAMPDAQGAPSTENVEVFGSNEVAQEVFSNASGWLERNAPVHAERRERREALLASVAATAMRGVVYADSSPPSGSDGAVPVPPDLLRDWDASVLAVHASHAPADGPPSGQSPWRPGGKPGACPVCGGTVELQPRSPQHSCSSRHAPAPTCAFCGHRGACSSSSSSSTGGGGAGSGP